MSRYRVTIYFEPDDLRDALATWEVDLEADDEDQAIAKAQRLTVCGYSAEPLEVVR